MKKLTKNQQALYDYIKSYITKYGYAPTVTEMKDELKVNYINSITQWLSSLEKHGLIFRKPNQHRGVYLTEDRGNSITTVVPVLSSVGCDNLQVLADHNYSDFLTVENDFVKNSKDEVVAFKAAGSSMVDAGIENGDYVLAERTETFDSGDLVVANIGDMSVVKRIQFTPGAVILNPESKNKKYQPIIMKDNSRVFGKVLDVIRMSPNSDEIRYEPIEEENH